MATKFPHSEKLFHEETSVTVSDVVNTRRFRNKRGIYWVGWANAPTGTFDLHLQIRPDADAPWTDYLVIDERDLSGNNANKRFVQAVYHFPQVRLNITSNTGAEVEAWYIQ